MAHPLHPNDHAKEARVAALRVEGSEDRMERLHAGQIHATLALAQETRTAAQVEFLKILAANFEAMEPNEPGRVDARNKLREHAAALEARLGMI